MIKNEKYDVTGMSCAACVAHVNKAVEGVEGVNEVNVNLLTNSMQVSYDSPASPEMICKAVEAAGYSKATKARLDGHKLQNLGWKPRYEICAGLERTMRILKERD